MTKEIETDPLWQRVADVFIAPARLAGRLGENPPWLDALIGTVILAAITVALLPDAVFLEPMEAPMTRRGEPVEITSPPAEIARWGRYFGMMATVATQPAFVFITAGILALLFGVLGGARTDFRCYVALAAHAAFIPVVGTLLEVAVQRLAGDPSVQPFGVPFLDVGPGAGVLEVAMAGVSPFFVWMLAVLAVGVAEVDARRRPASALLILLGIYFLFLLAGAAFLP